MELVADPIRDTCNQFEVLRSIHIGLLCVQQSLEDRPSMSNVVLMLSSEVPLAQPKQPGFFTERDLVEATLLLHQIIRNHLVLIIVQSQWLRPDKMRSQVNVLSYLYV